MDWTRRRHGWGPHEGDFLAWLRLRHALAQVLARPEMADSRPRALADGIGRPPSLVACRRRCFDRILGRMRESDIPVPGHATGGKPGHAPAWTSIEAAWRLMPAFSKDWSPAWRLWALEQEFGSREFSRESASQALRRHDQAVVSSPFHSGDRNVLGVSEEDVSGLTDAWCQQTPDGFRLLRQAHDAVTLLRFVVNPTLTVPADTLQRIPPIQPNSGRTSAGRRSRL